MMKNSFYCLVWMLVIFAPTASYAQNSGCDFDTGFAAFDFWLGEWTVFDSVADRLAGTNSIQKQEQGCLVMEKWTSVNGGTGTSLNYYNPLTQEWRQLWVSAGRYSIDIVGGLQDESMQLLGNIYYFTGEVNQFRGTWTPAEDGSVRQFFEQFNAETGEWDVWFDGRYVRAD